MPNRRKHRSAPSPFSYLAEPLEARTLLSAADPDITFGVNGVATTQFTGFGQSLAAGVAVQSDGKTVVAGFSYVGGVGEKVALARYNTNGSLDTTFGTGGKELIAAGNYGQANAVAIQTDGKIVFAGYSTPDQLSAQFLVGRVNTNGSLDTTFGTAGIDILSGTNANEVGMAVAVASTGNIVVGGLINKDTSHFVLARVTPTGVLDSTFGSGGMSIINYSSNFSSADAITALAFDSGGTLYGAVDVGTSTGNSVIGVAKFTSSGNLSLSYGSSGVATTSVHSTIFGGFGQRAAIAIQSDGKVDLAGGSSSFSAARFTTFGELDSNFGMNGVFTYAGHSDVVGGIGLLSTGDVVLTGSSTTGSLLTNDPMELRLTSAGVLDTSFNGTGVSILSTPVTVGTAVVRSTGVVTYAGNSPTVQDIMVGQFSAAGFTDGTFNGSGVTSLDIPTNVPGVAKAAMLQTDGKLIVAATYTQGVGFARGTQGVVTRYTTAGALDTTFGTGGYAYVTVGGTFNVISAVIQTNGDIVVEGTAFDAGHTTTYTAVERLLPTGAVDTSFGVGGIYLLNTSKGYDTFTSAAALLRLSDDSLLVVTSSSNGGQITKLSASQGLPVTAYGTAGTGIVKDPNHQWTTGTIDSTGLPVLDDGSLERYTAAGTLDSTFPNGTSAPSGGIGNMSMALQPDGGILSTTFSGTTLHRSLATGSNDSNFGSGGTVQVFANETSLGAVASLSNGDILVAGKQGSNMLCLAYDISGQPISQFGTSGLQTYAAGNATGAIAVRSNGKIILVGGSNTAQIVIQLNGDLPAIIPGSNATDIITLAQSANHQSINWTTTSNVVSRSGSVSIADAAGMIINASGTFGDVITLDYTNGNPLPPKLQLNGTFILNGLSGTNPLANTNLDINASTIIISYAGVAADPLNQIRSYLSNGYHAGLWNGTSTATTGVITSSAAAANASHSTAIAYSDSADGVVPQPANTIKLTYSLYGDTGLAGTVGFTDFMRMTQHYTQATGATWLRGDFNYDGAVNAADFALLQPNYGQSLPAGAPAPVEAPIVTPTRPTRVTTLPPAVSITVAESASTLVDSIAPQSPAKTAKQRRRLSGKLQV